MSKLTYTRDIIAESLLNDETTEIQPNNNGINISKELKNYSRGEYKIFQGNEKYDYDVIEYEIKHPYQESDIKNVLSKKNAYNNCLDDIKLLKDQTSRLLFPKTSKFYAMTLEDEKTSAYNIICKVFEFFNKKTCYKGNFYLILFSIFNIRSLDNLNKVIKLQSDQFKNINYLCDEYVKQLENSNISYAKLNLSEILGKKPLNLDIFNINPKYKHINYFIINTSHNCILNHINFMLENYLYRRLETINKSKIFLLIMFDQKVKQQYNTIQKEQKHNMSNELDLISQDLLKLWKNINCEDQLYEYEYYINKKTDKNNNIRTSITTKVSYLHFKYFSNRKAVQNLYKDKTFYHKGNNKCITIYEKKLIKNIDAQNKALQILKVLKITTEFDSYLLHYNYIKNMKTEGINTIEIQIYDKILEDPISLIYEMNQNIKKHEYNKNFKIIDLDKKQISEILLRNLINHLIEIHDKNNIRFQNLYGSLLFDEFLFNVKSFACFNYKQITKLEKPETMIENFRNVLELKLPHHKIQLESVNFMFGTDQFIKNCLQIPIKKDNSNPFEFKKKLFYVDLNIAIFLKKHCRYFAIGKDDGLKPCFLYDHFKIFRFEVIKDSFVNDSFFAIIIWERLLLYYFGMHIFDVIDEYLSLPILFNEVEKSLSAKIEKIPFLYTVNGVDRKEKIDLFQKCDEDDTYLSLLWRNFRRFTGYEVVYIFMQGEFHNYLKACFNNFKYKKPTIDPKCSGRILYIEGEFELGSLISALNNIFMHLKNKIYEDFRKTYIPNENDTNHVIFASHNVDTDNFVTYLNIYDAEVSKKQEGKLSNFHIF
ncbi:hypothetical protein COBT_001961 [Conglomerata obtusa]